MSCLRHKPMHAPWVLCALILLQACGEEAPQREPGGVYISACFQWFEPVRESVDLLFVIDSSPRMADFQPNLRTQLSAFMHELRNMIGGLPDVHIGVVTSDLGAGPYDFNGCAEGGDQGRFHVGACPSATGLPYLVDVRPSGCMIWHTEASDRCSDHNCTEVNCGHEPRAYAGGHPYARDWQLPVPACWSVKQHNYCYPSRTEIVIARRADPPPRSFVDICCTLAPTTEQSCGEGLDSDEDCLVDGEDPDCEDYTGPAINSSPSSG